MHEVCADLAVALLGLALLKVCLDVGLVLVESVEAVVLCKLVVQFRQLVDGEVVKLDLEHNGLAGELGSVVLGEGDVDVLLVADVHADNLFLEAGDEGAGAKLKVICLGLAAVETLAVEITVEVDVGDITHLSLALNVYLAGVALAGSFELVADLVLVYLCGVALCAQTLVLAEGDLGVEGDGEGVSDGLVIGDVDVNDGGGADELDVVLGHALLESLGSQLVHSVLIEHLCAVHAFDDCAGSLALAETGDIYAVLILQICGVDGSFKLGCVGLDLKSKGVIFFFLYVLDNHLDFLLYMCITQALT